MDKRKFNENITLLREAEREDEEKLSKDEFFVLMVMDEDGRRNRLESDYWDFSKGEIGVERTSVDEVYISKKYNARRNPLRGITWLVEVKDTDKCCILTA